MDTNRPGMERLVRLAVELGAERVGGVLSSEEAELCRSAPPHSDLNVGEAKAALRAGEDPFTDRYLQTVSPDDRYRSGVVLTPARIVQAMMAEAARTRPSRIVDMGCGTGRFTREAVRRVGSATIVAVDIDPLATLLTRASLAALGHRDAQVIQGSYIDLALDPVRGATAFVGNPPYARHHELTREQKAMAAALARKLGFPLSGLSGLHAHFLFATAANAAPGDVGCVITSAEWMMVSYGQAVRDLLAGPLGLTALHVLDPKAMAFPDTMTTAVISTFRAGGSHREVSVTPHATPETLGRRNGVARRVRREDLAGTSWGFLLWNGRPHVEAKGTVALRDFFRVHRGIATGENGFFVMTPGDAEEQRLLPWVRPVLTRAKEVISSSGVVRRGSGTKMLLCPPRDVDLHNPRCAPLREYLLAGERTGVPARYLCAHRRLWWLLGDPEPAPIVATYMARQPPSFAWNPDRLLNLNTIHGLYPQKPFSEETMEEIVALLNAQREDLRGLGRVYQGGLEKFEPHELEAVRLSVGRHLARTVGST